jgi:hypothetical protein
METILWSRMDGWSAVTNIEVITRDSAVRAVTGIMGHQQRSARQRLGLYTRISRGNLWISASWLARQPTWRKDSVAPDAWAVPVFRD